MSIHQGKNLYRVRWELDVMADTAEEAAFRAREVQQDAATDATMFGVALVAANAPKMTAVAPSTLHLLEADWARAEHFDTGACVLCEGNGWVDACPKHDGNCPCATKQLVCNECDGSGRAS